MEKDTERDFFMTSSEAKKYGIIDGVVEGAKGQITKIKKDALPPISISIEHEKIAK